MTRVLRRVGIVLMGLGLYGCGPPAVVEPGAVVLEVDRAGPLVIDDVESFESLTGDAVPSEELIRGASCHNAVRWIDDVSLDTSVLVATRAELVRVAELVADGRVSAELAEVMESSWWNGGDVVADALQAGFSEVEIDEFESLIAQPPSEAALDRFVVYVVSETFWRQGVVYLDVDALSISSVKSFSGRFPSLETMIAGSQPYEFPTKECVTVDNPMPEALTGSYVG